MLSTPDKPQQLPRLGEKFTINQFNFDICSDKFVIIGMIIKKNPYNLNWERLLPLCSKTVETHKEKLKKQHTVQLLSGIHSVI